MLLYNPESSRNRDYLNAYLNVTLTHSFEEFKEYKGEKFFLLTIFDIWLANPTDTIGNINWETVFSNELLQELKTKKYPILFENASECSIKVTFDTLENFCNYIDINSNNVYVCLANTQSVHLNLNAYPKISQYNLFSIERFALDAVQFGYSMGKLLNAFKFSQRKRFLFLNRRYSSDRAYMYLKFHKFNLLDSMHCTFNLDNVYDDNLVTLHQIIKDISLTHNNSCKEVIDYIKSNTIELEASLPHKIKTSDVPIYNIDHKKSCIYTFWNLAAHNSTDINIITETFRYHCGISDTDIHHQTLFFITEKTYRTILMKQPFILFSNPYALKYLKNDGYKTFSPFIDESYDTIENLADRQNAIINEVCRIHSMKELEFNYLLTKCREIAEYNYTNLMTRESDKFHNTVWTNNNLKPYLRDIDRNLKPATLFKWHNKY